jgi:hypothetical protein
VDKYTGVRGVTLLAPLLVFGLITGNVGQASLIILGAIWVSIGTAHMERDTKKGAKNN